MTDIPDRNEQIRLVHADFIRQVVETCVNPDRQQDFATLLRTAEQNGWSALARALRRIATGERGANLFDGLDEEDQVIAAGILRGLQDPATLPDPQSRADPTVAAPGLAHMILKTAVDRFDPYATA